MENPTTSHYNNSEHVPRTLPGELPPATHRANVLHVGTRLRESVVTVRMTTEERKWLQNLAEEDGISVSDVVRVFVRREHRKRFGNKRKYKV
jgi:hypothetical protein